MRKEKEVFDLVCDNCGKTFTVNKSRYNKSLKSKNHFCSSKCQHDHQKTGSIIKCENCGKEFYLSKQVLESSEHHFCSVKCAHSSISHSHPHSDETKEKIRQGVLNHNEKHGFTKPVLTEEQRRDIVEKLKMTWNKKLLESNWDELSYESKRKRVELEQHNKCARCGLDTWMGEKIILEYEHKDGNHFNNSRDNVECLCPNCHSLTPTWRGRNKAKSNRPKHITEEEIVEAFIKEGNIRKTLICLGLAAKGNNYDRVKKVFKKYGIEIEGLKH